MFYKNQNHSNLANTWLFDYLHFLMFVLLLASGESLVVVPVVLTCKGKMGDSDTNIIKLPFKSARQTDLPQRPLGKVVPILWPC